MFFGTIFVNKTKNPTAMRKCLQSGLAVCYIFVYQNSISYPTSANKSSSIIFSL